MDQINGNEHSITSDLNDSNDHQMKVNLLLLIIYFIIRIPIIFLVSIDPSRNHWEFVAIYLVLYLIISTLIWKNGEELYSFHIDKFFIFIFFLFGSLFRFRGIDNFLTLLFEFLLFLFILIFSVAFIKRKIQIKSFSVINKWNLLAIFSGFLLAFLIILLNPLIQYDNTKRFSILLFTGIFLKNLFIEIGLSAIIEEPIYRGFLWGTLLKRNWPEFKILFFQAFLFWISHISYLNQPFTFWITAPSISLLLGYLTMKSKSIIPPLITHVIYNAFLVSFVAVNG